MLLDPKHEERLGRLEGQLRCAQAVTPELMVQVIAQLCTRFAACGPAAQTRVSRLIDSGARTEAALALVEFELPKWRLRRLVHEDDEWFCSLSRHPWLPLGLDELAGPITRACRWRSCSHSFRPAAPTLKAQADRHRGRMFAPRQATRCAGTISADLRSGLGASSVRAQSDAHNDQSGEAPNSTGASEFESRSPLRHRLSSWPWWC